MVLLPELLSRWSLGRALLDAGDTDPTAVPVIPEGGTWPQAMRALYPEAVLPSPPSIPKRARAKLARTLTPRRRQQFQLDLGWMPAAWYRSAWPRAKAFALPSFYDGRIRFNVAGREHRGVIPLDEYVALGDELEQLLAEVRDPRTGEPVVDTITRLHDPMSARANDADMVVVWRGSALAFEHPAYGVLGPAPYRRTGGHTGPHGFAWVSGAGIDPCDVGVHSAYDVVPTLIELVGAPSMPELAGESLLPSFAEKA
jgi:predicted AlkP superfamily phosphohydrolase/phosphomutase